METTDLEKSLNITVNGKMAELAYGAFHSVLVGEISRILESLKSEYKSGDVTNETVLARVAAICALDDLDKKIERTIKNARKEESRIYGKPNSTR